MSEAREHRTLAPKPFLPRRAEQREIQQLDRGEPLKSSVRAFRQPHGAHAAVTEHPVQRVGADRYPLEREIERPNEETLMIG